MDWSMTDMSWQGDQVDYQKYHMADLSQAQAQQTPTPSNSDWNWTGDARTAWPTTWNAVSTPQAMPTVSEHGDWNTPSSVNAISTGVDNPNPSPGLDYFLGNTAAVFSRTDRISPGGQSTAFPGHASREGNNGDSEVMITRPHARLPARSKKTRRPQQSQERPPRQPFRCKWDGCRYSGTFNKESSLIRHLKNIHFSPGAYPCPIEDCEKVPCNRADTLMQHMRNVHG